jgi:hypothetical protein
MISRLAGRSQADGRFRGLVPEALVSAAVFPLPVFPLPMTVMPGPPLTAVALPC